MKAIIIGAITILPRHLGRWKAIAPLAGAATLKLVLIKDWKKFLRQSVLTVWHENFFLPLSSTYSYKTGFTTLKNYLQSLPGERSLQSPLPTYLPTYKNTYLPTKARTYLLKHKPTYKSTNREEECYQVDTKCVTKRESKTNVWIEFEHTDRHLVISR